MPHYVPSRVTARVIDKITPYLMYVFENFNPSAGR